MVDSSIELNDLPDEILMMILKKLHNSDVLYSLIDANKRLDTIVKDSIFTNNLTLTTPFNGLNQFPDTIIDRFCREILPKINTRIQSLSVESSTMERILLATNYPNLHRLDGSYLIRLFKNQITSLVIYIKESEEPKDQVLFIGLFIFRPILSMFNNLRYLNFSLSSEKPQLSFCTSHPAPISSTLLELRVVVKSMKNCLYLISGCFSQLHTFYVTISPSHNGLICPEIKNKRKLPNLKCFSFFYDSELSINYDDVVSLVQRMSNLEELNLFFISRYGSIIDGNSLETNIINHLTKLNKFTFNIRSIVLLKNLVNLPLNDEIKNTFKNFRNNQIISTVEYFSTINQVHCYIYSYPYIWTSYFYITNHFADGLFKCVRRIFLTDERPFEHEFFLRIQNSFPFIEKLCLFNREPQKNDSQQWSIIQYSHLTQLDLRYSHENYVEQFLINTKTCLLNNVSLHVNYDSLRKATDNFKRDTTRVNSLKIIDLYLYSVSKSVRDITNYFSHAKLH
ncbi:unnamed protein product [Rotaria sp. Silwood2]|nr:unnamed protein product [Rotaria sp. Silwood2]